MYTRAQFWRVGGLKSLPKDLPKAIKKTMYFWSEQTCEYIEREARFCMGYCMRVDVFGLYRTSPKERIPNQKSPLIPQELPMITQRFPTTIVRIPDVFPTQCPAVPCEFQTDSQVIHRIGRPIPDYFQRTPPLIPNGFRMNSNSTMGRPWPPMGRPRATHGRA